MDRNRIAIFFEVIKNMIGIYAIYWKNELFFIENIYLNIDLFLGFYFIASMIATTWLAIVNASSQKTYPLLQ